jgi:hypothetical protein
VYPVLRDFICLFLLIWALYPPAAQAVDPVADAARIRQELVGIRRNTNWDNPKEARKANERIHALMLELEQGRRWQAAAKAGASGAGADAGDTPVVNQAMVWEKVQESAARGKQSPFVLTEALRKQIIKEYEDERDPQVKNPAFFEELSTLVIDLSTAPGKATIEQLDQFKSIKTLIITGGQHGAPIALDKALAKAAGLPLEALYIINFRHFVQSVPDAVARLTSLKKLSLVNNQIRQLPQSMAGLYLLSSLYLDMNPLATVPPVVERMPWLQQLGVGATPLSNAEITRVRKSIPNCKVLTQ